MTKTQRQHRIGELIERERISTAAQLVTRLQSEGISATQATLSPCNGCRAKRKPPARAGSGDWIHRSRIEKASAAAIRCSAMLIR